MSMPDPTEAFALMRRAVEALSREGRTATGASVNAMMRQLSPAYDLARYRLTMKDLALGAQETGYVRITEIPGSDFTLSVAREVSSPAIARPQTASPSYDFSSSVDAITASYRAILQYERIPLLPWGTRREFTDVVWGHFEERGAYGIHFDGMRENLEFYAMDNNINVSRQMVQKFLYTLNFGRCFAFTETSASGSFLRIPEDVDVPVYPAVSAEEAVRRSHRQYLHMIARKAPILHPDAAFDLLYGEEVTDEDERRERLEDLARICNDIKPMDGFGQAMLNRISAMRTETG